MASAAIRGFVRDVRRGRLAGRVVVEGARLVAEAVARGAAVELLLISPHLASRPLPPWDLARMQSHPQALPVTDAEMERLSSGGSHQGVLAVVALPSFAPDDCLQEGGWLVVLDGVQDPLNFGAIARSARAFGASGIWYREGGAAPYSSRAYRAAAGALLDLPVARVADIASALSSQQRAVFVAAADGEPIGRLWPNVGPGVLVLGSEGAGTQITLGHRIAIPMRAGSESLNVAQAAAILLSRTYAAGL